MLPNIQPPVNRSERARQQHVKHRAPQQSFRGAVGASGIACTLCMLACDQLSGIAKSLCQTACNHTVC